MIASKSRLFPSLDVLNAITNRVGRTFEQRFARTMFVCVQHLLETTGSLVESLLDLGAAPCNIFILGKCYSTSESVLERLRHLGVRAVNSRVPAELGTYRSSMVEDVERLWEAASSHITDDIDRVILIDDGGVCLNGLSENLANRVAVVGIEQTTSGLSGLDAPRCPVIEVASSAAKRIFEPRLIASALRDKIADLFLDRVLYRCGVIGFGSIGRAVVAELREQGHGVSVYDIAEIRGDVPAGVTSCGSLAELLSAADLIFGCAGSDVVAHPRESLGPLAGHKTFVSCSSSDIEFNTLLREIGSDAPQLGDDPLGTLEATFPHSSLDVTIVRGGFPANFDRSRESVRSVDIQLTRGLLLGATLQASEYPPIPSIQPRREMLSPYVQRYVIDEWAERCLHGGTLSAGMPPRSVRTDIGFLRSQSGGVVPRFTRLDAILSPKLRESV